MHMDPSASILGLLMFLVGGGNDLLDYLPPDAYWQAKHVQVTRNAMTAELAAAPAEDASKLIDDLSNPDPQARNAAVKKLSAMGPKVVPQLRAAVEAGDPETVSLATDLIKKIGVASKEASVRRLMAVRALGDMKEKWAVDVLDPLLASKEPFEADYAAAAIAEIRGLPSSRPSPPAAARAADAWGMPDTCATVLQFTAHPGRPVSLDALAASMMTVTNQTKQQMLDQAYAHLIEAADKLGNVRLDAVTVGVAGVVGPNAGHAVVVVRGVFDAKAAAGMLQDPKFNSRPVGGVDVYDVDPITKLFFAGDDRAVLVLGGPNINLPIEAIVAAVTAGQNDLRGSKDVAPLLAAADMTLPAWGVMKVTPSYRQASVLAPFDTLSLTGKPAGGATELKLTASGTDPDGARSAASEFNHGLQQLLGEAKPAAAMFPVAKPLIAVLESIHCAADGGNAAVTAQIPRSLMDQILNPGPTTKPE